MKRSIATRLTVAALLIFVSLLIITALALSSFSGLFKVATHIKDHHLLEASLFEDIRVLLTDAVGQDHAYVVTGGEETHHQAFGADIASVRRLFAEHAKLHVNVPITPPEVEGMTRLRAATDRLAGVHEEVVRLASSGHLNEARQVSETNGKEAADAALAMAMSLVNVERQESDEQLADARETANKTYDLILVIALLSSVISGAAAVSVIRSVTVPVRRLVETTRRVDRGNLSIRSGLAGSDEIGELAQSFDRMVERLETAFSEQDRFLADISHELRTPITIVRGHLEVLERGPRTTAQIDRALSIGVDELDRMARLVNDLLLLVRATRTDFLTPELFDLRTFLSSVLQKAEAIAPREWRLGPVTPSPVVADRDRLTQALLNLLRNAAEHTQPGAPIELSAALRNGTVEIAVADKGEGIAPELLPYVFDRFRRGKSAETRTGWGLGLSIVQAIARAHGGEVRIESRPGAGSTFTVVLPQNRLSV